MTNRWDGRVAGADYAARFEALAATGMDMHGEASFVAALAQPGARILDAGCGTGRVAIRLQSLGFSCEGVDSDASMIEVARAAADLPWHLEDLAVFAAAGFDIVVAAGNVIPLLAPGTEAAVVSNLAAALVPGGLLVAGFGLDAAHLPLAEAPFGLDEYDEWCAAAGLTLAARFPAWNGVAGEIGGYAVSVHRR